MLSGQHIKTSLRRDVRAWLKTGLNNAEGRLSLFDGTGQRIPSDIQRQAISQGLAEGWFANPMRPDWMVCRLTPLGREALSAYKTARQG